MWEVAVSVRGVNFRAFPQPRCRLSNQTDYSNKNPSLSEVGAGRKCQRSGILRTIAEFSQRPGREHNPRNGLIRSASIIQGLIAAAETVFAESKERGPLRWLTSSLAEKPRGTLVGTRESKSWPPLLKLRWSSANRRRHGRRKGGLSGPCCYSNCEIKSRHCPNRIGLRPRNLIII